MKNLYILKTNEHDMNQRRNQNVNFKEFRITIKTKCIKTFKIKLKQHLEGNL